MGEPQHGGVCAQVRMGGPSTGFAQVCVWEGPSTGPVVLTAFSRHEGQIRRLASTWNRGVLSLESQPAWTSRNPGGGWEAGGSVLGPTVRRGGQWTQHGGTHCSWGTLVLLPLPPSCPAPCSAAPVLLRNPLGEKDGPRACPTGATAPCPGGDEPHGPRSESGTVWTPGLRAAFGLDLL